MPGYSLRFRLLPVAALLCVGSCLSTNGYYRDDGGASGTAGSGTPGAAGTSGSGGTTGGGGSSGTAGGAGTTQAGSGGTGGQAPGVAGAAGSAAARGGTTGTAGRGGTTGTAGRGGATGAGGTPPGGTVLLMENFDPQTGIWDFGTAVTHSLMADGAQGQTLAMTEAAGDEALGAAGMGTWTNYSVEAKVKITALPGTSSSDGVAICARLSGAESYYYFAIQAGDMKGKIKINNGGNSSLSSSFDAGFVMNTWLTMRLDVTGTPATGITLTAYVNGTMRATYTVPTSESDHLLAMGGIGFMVRKATAQFDDVVVRALP
jgi:hypothetical protein